MIKNILAFLSGCLNFQAIVRAPFTVFMGTVDAAPGAPVGYEKAIANLFQKELILKHYSTSVISQITNTNADRSGIKEMGDKVTFERLPDTQIRKYQKGGDMIMDRQKSTFVDLTVNRANYFYFGEDVIDLKQYTIKGKLDKQVEDADKKVKEYVDTEFLASVYADASTQNKGATAGAKSAHFNFGTTGAPVGVSNTNIVKKIAELSGACQEQNMDKSGRFLVLPSIFKVLINQSDLTDTGMSGKDSVMFADYMGKLHDFDIYTSNLYTSISDTGQTCYPILYGHTDAICYVAQLTQMDYFEKLERTAGQAMRGLMVYDWKTIDPLMLGVWYAYAV
jgi:hypothetical protein